MPLPFPHSHLYIVSVNEYDDPAIDDLFSPANDAAEVAGILSAAPHFFSVHTPLSSTQQDIISLLASMPDTVGTKDRVVFYFAGHGITLRTSRKNIESTFNLLYFQLRTDEQDYQRAMSRGNDLPAARKSIGQLKRIIHELNAMIKLL